MQSEVNQGEKLNRIIMVPNLLSFFSALSDSGNYMELLCKEKSSVSWCPNSTVLRYIATISSLV